jgi:protease YdgD
VRKVFLLMLLALTGLVPVAGAQESTIRVLSTADDARAWEAVGRVNLIGTGFCTGTLIAPDMVLTAAHCMFDKRTGQRVALDEIEFLAGWRDGRAAATRGARRVLIHRDYAYFNDDRLDRVAADIALIELDQPIRNARIMPFGRAPRPRVGQSVQVVSYSKDRADQPSLEETCAVLGRDPKVLVLSCHVNFGASGAPIFVMDRGQPRIASVVSAKAEWNDRKVALGAALGGPLEMLIGEMLASDGIIRKVQPVSSDLSTLTGSGQAASRFKTP